MIDLNAISERHHAWVERMGWHNKTVLESLALIASEIGEAAGECLGGFSIPERFGEELADIILRCVDLAKTEGVNLNEQVALALQEIEWVTDTASERITEVLIDFGKWCNTARKTPLGPDFGAAMGTVVARVIDLAARHRIDLHTAVQLKLKKNELNGTRGRPI